MALSYGASATLDNQLGEAAMNGDVGFVRQCVANNAPHHYFLQLLLVCDYFEGNILHISMRENQIQFIEEVIGLLPEEVIRRLLIQPRSPTNSLLNNPLHLAAYCGNTDVVNLFLEFCKSHPSLFFEGDDDKKPWLQTNERGRTPCQVAVFCARKECALEILKMDMEKLSNVVDDLGDGLLSLSVHRGLDEVALKVLESPSFSCSGRNNNSPLHYLPYCSGGLESQDMCRLLIEKVPSMVTTTSDTGYTILHAWAQLGKVWPFECILNCNDLYTHDLNRVLVDLMYIASTDFGQNPFHILAHFAPTTEEDAIKIAKILIKTFRQIVATQPAHFLPSPWLLKDKNGNTPLKLSLIRSNEKLARYILSVENDTCMEYQSDNLLFAINHGCQEVAEVILNSVARENWTNLVNDGYFNALHFAPHCKEEFVQLLIDGNRKLMEGISKDGRTILHSWMEIGKSWPFRYILQRAECDLDCRGILLVLISKKDRSGKNIFHFAARYYNETTTLEIVQLLADGYKKLYSTWYIMQPAMLPWLQHDFNNDGALHEAIIAHRQTLALQILSLREAYNYQEILDLDELKCKTLFLAMENKCYQVVRKIVEALNKQSWTPYLENSFNRQNILHLAQNCTDKEFGKWLAITTQEFITKQDISGITPLVKASDAGVDWLVRAMILTNPASIFRDVPLAWVNACKNGHDSTVRAFIECHPKSFKNHCLDYKISPLHHIKLPKLRSYEDFLKLPYMMDLINVQDFQGATPLHVAIRNDDIYLTEVLLRIRDTLHKIKDDNSQTARSLLRKKYKEDKLWKKMCQDVGYDPNIRINYLQRKTNLLDVRNTLSVVAALLATITFTAGFTLPGGFNQDTGEAILAKRAAFLVFIISDTLALCCSMLVLICLVWSMVNDPSKSMLLIDRSMKLLMVSLYSTMIAFMCGVFIVISQKSLGVAILVIVMCSVLAIAIKQSILYKLLDKLFPSSIIPRRAQKVSGDSAV